MAHRAPAFACYARFTVTLIRGRFLLLLLSAAVTVVAALTIFNNNLSLWPPSRSSFQKRLDASRAASRDWILDLAERPLLTPGDETAELLSNPALLHMIADSAGMSGDRRLGLVLPRYLSVATNAYWWARLVDPSLRFERPPESYLATLPQYNRWFLYAIAPHEISLSEEDRANLLDPEKFRWGHLTHQLMALYFYRRSNGSTADVNRVISRLVKRIALEEAVDFRVTDLYLQRIATLLAVGRPDLVRRRWVERALDAQQPDGGWTFSWYGWDPVPLRFSFTAAPSVSHTTVQGMWIMYLLQYRCPRWIDMNYR